jgi:hypothetical protein
MKIMHLVGENWCIAWRDRKFRINTIGTFLALLIVIIIAPPYFKFVEARNGYQLDDFVLNQIPPRDFSGLIFILIYFTMSLNVLLLFKTPVAFVNYFQIYLLVILGRLLCIFLLPLEAPIGIIPLKDNLVYGDKSITKDLFYSGHVSTLFLYYFTAQNIYFKFFNLIITTVVGVLILIQHVHYTIDVLAAFIVVWLIFSFVSKYQNASAMVK